MKVSFEIGTYQPWGSDHFIDCMLVKEEGKNEYEALDFLGIDVYKRQPLETSSELLPGC